MTNRVLRMSLLAVLGSGILSSAVQADDADGVARVSHVTSHPVYKQPLDQSYYVSTPWADHYHHPGHYHSHRQPPNPTYWTWMPLPFHGCCDYCADPNCPGDKGFWTFPFVRWVLDPDYYAVAPDYGWSPPAKVPVRRSNVTYGHHAGHHHGDKQGQHQFTSPAPIVGTPTDTTQLGYYYQHVPTWQHKNILPVPPHPRHWHTRPCQPDRNMTYVRWVRLRNTWVPLHHIPQVKAGTPTPAEPEKADPAIPAPPQEGKPAPVIPMAPPNAPEALNVPEIADPIRRVSS